MHTDRKTLKPLKIGELTVEKPIIQGGMGVGVSRSNLAGAVAAEGKQFWKSCRHSALWR